MSRRKSPVTQHSENVITWFFAGLLIIAAVAGLFGQVVAGWSRCQDLFAVTVRSNAAAVWDGGMRAVAASAAYGRGK